MCFNKEVSLVIFLFGIIACIKLFKNKEKFMANKNNQLLTSDNYSAISGSILLSIALMQFVEFLLWSSAGNTKSTLHQWANVLVFVTIYLQLAIVYPLVINVVEEDKKIVLSVFFGIATAIFIPIMYLIGYKKFGSFNAIDKGSCSISCRLSWDFNAKFIKYYNILYLLFSALYFVSTFIVFYEIFDISVFIGLIASVLISFFIETYNNHMKPKYFGSLWCFVVVIGAACVLLYI